MADAPHDRNNVPAMLGTNAGVAVPLAVDSSGNLVLSGVTIGDVLIKPSTTGTETNVASSATDVTILAANTARLGASVYNDSTQILYLLLAAGTSSATNYTVQMPPNSFFELSGPSVYNGIIKGLWAAVNGNARVTENT